MTQSATAYINPTCGTCKTALGLLTDYQAAHSLDLTVVKYLDTPPSKATIISLLALLFPNEASPDPTLMMRTTSKEFADLKLDQLDPKADREQLIDAIVKEPILLARPIFVTNGHAIIARPADRVFELLDAGRDGSAAAAPPSKQDCGCD
ncbi:Aste57867_21622 [Aphanomyces stellatus]|uniref:Aste57867_21622 protein n=1 Tax=Aphanomyces stellatus TaxID=120398 RepID=A0A485LIN2_9STRA|nr:hypothetical protein As57867_021553 [Aphanomyces stellatus]VFT98292.1 Aste57867_21622 [Aphanomyces stellatus]